MGTRDEASVSANGVLSVSEVTTRDTTMVVNGRLTVVQIDAADVDRTWVENDRLTVIESGGVPPTGYAWLHYKYASGNYRPLLFKNASGEYKPLAYKVA